MKNFVRGASVHIALTFYDATGNVVTPTGANVTLSYIPIASDPPERTFVTYALIKDGSGSDWYYDWDSSVATIGPVYGHAVTTTPAQPVSSVDFGFRLTANRANKELSGDDSSDCSYG
jgi:hypothetical protein